ncbi:hypothetical protein [Streptomyces gilvosporeus]|uniref:hypothetical protein n=1 Tax=Streptomyces gilvosporeus TaxID=553510 RepID=UPI00131E411A|nr:hypothetical protein [Streptomyces gilvosporeus]
MPAARKPLHKPLLIAAYTLLSLIGPVLCALRDPLRRRWDAKARTYWEFTRG